MLRRAGYSVGLGICFFASNRGWDTHRVGASNKSFRLFLVASFDRFTIPIVLRLEVDELLNMGAMSARWLLEYQSMKSTRMKPRQGSIP